MAHFDASAPLRTHHTFEYGSLTVLAETPNCTHLQNPLTQVK